MPKNLARKASNSKKQTRLTFDPVVRGSSPASAVLSPANVRYELPGGKRAPSSNLKKVADSSESDDILLSATMVPEGSTSAIRRSTRNLPLKSLPTPAKSSQSRFTSDFLDDSEDNVRTAKDTDTPSHESSTRKKTLGFLSGSKAYKRPALNEVESSEGSEPEEANITPSKRATTTQQKPIVEPAEISSESDTYSDIPAIVSAKKAVNKTPPRRSTRNGPANPETITVSDSDDDLALPPPKSKQGRSGLFKRKRPFQSWSFSSKLAEEDDEDDDDPIISSPKRSQRPVFRDKKESDFDSEEEEEEEDIKSSIRRPVRPIIATSLDEDEEDDIVSPLKRRRPLVESDSGSDIVESPLKRQRNAQSSEDSDSDDDLPSPSKMRRQGSRVKSESPQRFTRQARTRKHRTKQEKTLELIKRKRAGEKITELTDTEPSNSEDDEDEPAFEKLSEFEDDDDDEEEEVQPKQKVVKEGSDSTEDFDEDFIVEDDENDPLGVPSMHSIPLEFTHQAHKPLKEHFKDAVEWMVHNKINPAFPRDDPVYEQAFRKLETECSGLAKSKFSSTQWTRDFTAALYARPVFISGELEEGEGIDLASGRPKCDACNHRSHVPSKFIQFQGKPYVQRTLEELDQDDDSDEDDSDDSDRVDVNDKGQDLPPEKTKWFVGRHCFANAEQSHTLIHWKFALYEWVKDTLESEGELLPTKLADRERMKAKQRTAYANALVDRWAEENQIRDLYRDFKNQVSTARDLQQGKRGAWV